MSLQRGVLGSALWGSVFGVNCVCVCGRICVAGYNLLPIITFHRFIRLLQENYRQGRVTSTGHIMSKSLRGYAEPIHSYATRLLH